MPSSVVMVQLHCNSVGGSVEETRKIAEMLADPLATSNGGPVVSHTRGLVGDRVPPSHSQPVFQHVLCHGTGDAAAAC